MRVKRRDTEQWMAHRLLPENLKGRILRHEQYRWQETRGVDEEGLLMNLPKDLRREIKRHLCLSLLMRVFSPSLHGYTIFANPRLKYACLEITLNVVVIHCFNGNVETCQCKV